MTGMVRPEDFPTRVISSILKRNPGCWRVLGQHPQSFRKGEKDMKDEGAGTESGSSSEFIVADK